MRLSSTLLLAGLLPSTLLAFPTARLDDLVSRDTQDVLPPLIKRTPGKSQIKGKSQVKGKKGKANGNGKGAGNATVIVVETPAPVAAPVVAAPVVATPAPVAAPVVEAPAAGEEEEALPGELELAGVFGTPVALGGGDIKQDVVFTAGAIGKFEFEFQSLVADELTVVENKTPAAPPTGFIAIEPSSYQVSLAVSAGANLTLSKIDYIFDVTNAAVLAQDITKAQVGRLCAETGTFIIDAALGELEFEVEENEVTLNLNKAVTANGEWGIFLPVAAAEVAPPAAGNATEAIAGNATAVVKAPAAKQPKVVSLARKARRDNSAAWKLT